jgi:hypothetical protein
MTFGELISQVNEELANEYLTDSIDNYEIDMKSFDERDDDAYDILSIEINHSTKSITLMNYKEIK